MKKILSVLVLVLVLGLVGCGEYEPTLAQYNEVYRSTTNKNDDGSYAIINISKIEKDDTIIVTASAPGYEILEKNFNKFIAFEVKDEKGKSLKVTNTKIVKDEESTKFIIKCDDIDKAKYIQMLPYKLDKDWIEFKLN